MGGNKGKRFTEGIIELHFAMFLASQHKPWIVGWVEFADKRVAKRVAQGLNNTQIGGKKSSRYYDDIWSIKVVFPGVF